MTADVYDENNEDNLIIQQILNILKKCSALDNDFQVQINELNNEKFSYFLYSILRYMELSIDNQEYATWGVDEVISNLQYNMDKLKQHTRHIRT